MCEEDTQPMDWSVLESQLLKEAELLSFCEKVKSRIPILTWLPKYSLEWLVSDMIAGITVGLTVIPQVWAYFEPISSRDQQAI